MTEIVATQKEPRVQRPAAAEVQHAEPQEGGSFTRNLDTGALTKAEPAPVSQPAQE